MLQIFTSSQIETPNIFTCSIKALRFPFLSAPPAKRFCPAPPSRSSQKHKSPRSRQVRRWKIGGSCVMLKDTSAGFWRAWWMWMSRSKSHNMRRGNARSLLSFSTKWPMETKEHTIASFVLNEVADGDKRVPQYLALLSENKDGMPFDYNAIRVFTWNVRRHRYETAYRERNLNGVLPVMVSKENFDKEGELPVFVLRVKDEDGNLTERKYKLATPIVKRVLAPGEQPPATRKRTRRR